jgi:dephospho-CoA kinase
MGSGKKKMSYPSLRSQWIRLSKEERLYQLSVPVIGLTGGIATGKSSFAHLLREKGVHVIDADKLIKKIYQKEDVIAFIKENVPLALEGGKINFRHLREQVFGKADLKSNLEQFLYAHMPTTFKEEINQRPEATWVIYDVPLLFERSLNYLVDQSIVVYTTPQIQLDRLMKRDHIDQDFAERIISHQMPIEEKKKLAHYVVDNSGGLENHPEIFSKLWKDLVD